MAKPEKKAKARHYRQQGKSMKWIAEKLQVARSSVSVWTRDIQLTPEQEENLQNSNARRDAQKKGSQANLIKHRNKRKQYQEEGRAKAREKDSLHLAGCMLYWAEGSKNRNEIKFVNSDADMIRVFMKFLRECLLIDDKDIKIRIVAYLGNDLSKLDIQNYWLSLVGLDKTHLNKCVFDNQPSSSQQKGRKLLYGVCEIRVYSTKHMQHIYGAIQEYMQIDRPEWLD
mgnify:CR=1 FL=1